MAVEELRGDEAVGKVARLARRRKRDWTRSGTVFSSLVLVACGKIRKAQRTGRERAGHQRIVGISSQYRSRGRLIANDASDADIGARGSRSAASRLPKRP
jgi:hypothetical protein